MTGRFIAIGLLASLAATGASAAGRADVWTTGQTLALCHLGGDKTRLEKALLADPMAGAFEDWHEQRDKTCTALGVQPRGDFYRYAVAEAIFRRDLKQVHLQTLSQVAPLLHNRAPFRGGVRVSKEERERETALQAAAVRFSILGECVVRTDPATSHAILMTRPESDIEMAAFGKLMPAVERCVAGTSGLKMDLGDLRGAIALNYVRLAKAARNQQSGASQ